MFVINLNGFSTFVAPPHGERGLKLTAFGLQASDSCRSPPRGAWIEIQNVLLHMPLGRVAPPHGERGLKSLSERYYKELQKSLPPTGSVD